MNPLVSYAVEDGVAVLTLDNRPVNALGWALRRALIDALARAGADADAIAIVLIGAGRQFSAGADITEFGQPPVAPWLPEVFEVIEGSAKPVVAAIHGVAFGGGLEMALACHYRVGAPSARLGLPEVNLGLLPGAGGTQRLPRIVGAKRALEMITSGAPVSAQDALAIGLLDAVVSEGELRADAIAFARHGAADRAPTRVRDRDERIIEDRRHPQLFDDFRRANACKFRGAEAPQACIRAVEAAVALPFEEGMALERELFDHLIMGEQSAAQRHAFFAERQVWKIPDIADDTPTRPIRAVGIVGAGVMGGGLAMTFANAGLPVAIVARRQETLDRCLATVRRNYGRSRSMTPDAVEQRMSLIVAGLDIQSIADCDLVIEAVPDSMDVKTEVLGRISHVLRPDALIASNTSFLDIDALADVVDGPERFLGLHFFSPANVMKLVEVVRGRRTAPDVIATAMRLARTIGKVGVLSGVCRGFIGNRMLAQRTRESLALLLEGASPGQVDKVLTDFGLPMGPFAMSDLAGLDIAWSRETSTGSTVREVLNEMGRHGQKAGAGYYDYDADGKPTPSPVVEQAILDLALRWGVIRREIADQEILERCLYPMVNEGAKILDEGVALRPGDIDVVWLNGYGWPRYRGGPMRWGGRLGLPTIVEALRRYEAAGHGDLKPAPLLERLAADGRTFQDL